MEWKREEFSVRTYDQGYELKFRGQVIDRYGRQDSRMDSNRMHYYGVMGTQVIDQLIFMGDTEELSPFLRAAIKRVEAECGTCRQCGKPFLRNDKGRPREFCDNNGECSAQWRLEQCRVKEGRKPTSVQDFVPKSIEGEFFLIAAIKEQLLSNGCPVDALNDTTEKVVGVLTENMDVVFESLADYIWDAVGCTDEWEDDREIT